MARYSTKKKRTGSSAAKAKKKAEERAERIAQEEAREKPGWFVEPVGRVPENLAPMNKNDEPKLVVDLNPSTFKPLPHPEEGDEEAFAAAVERAKKLRATRDLRKKAYKSKNPSGRSVLGPPT